MEDKITKENIFKHFTLFSLLGIFTIALNNFCAYFVGIEIPIWFNSPGKIETFIDLFIGLIIFIFLNGYYYKYVHALFNNEKAQIPEISLDCFLTFWKMLPLFLLWNIYIFVFVFLGMGLFVLGSLSSLIYFSILGIIIVFINLIYIEYAKDFNISSHYFTLKFLTNIISKTFFKVIAATVKFLCITGLTFYLMYQLFLKTLFIKNHGLSLGVILLLLCIGSYLFTIFNYFYTKKLVKILKNTK